MHHILPFRLPPRCAGRHACDLAVAAVVCLIAAVGCARSGAEITAAAAEKLSPSATAYVAVPGDGRFGTKVYAGSGRGVATLIARTLSPRFRQVVVADGEQAARAALVDARAGGFTYLIRPSILRWEDNAAAWSGSPDRAEILIEVIDAGSGNAADVAVIEAGGARISPSPGSEETPAAALEAPLKAYAERLLPTTAATAQQRAPQPEPGFATFGH